VTPKPKPKPSATVEVAAVVRALNREIAAEQRAIRELGGGTVGSHLSGMREAIAIVERLARKSRKSTQPPMRVSYSAASGKVVHRSRK
jgi:hypothetical protein